MSKKLGNYRWVTCNKCGERYAMYIGCKKHVCSEEKKRKNLLDKVKAIFK